MYKEITKKKEGNPQGPENREKAKQQLVEEI